jgi:hypothetical protein
MQNRNVNVCLTATVKTELDNKYKLTLELSPPLFWHSSYLRNWIFRMPISLKLIILLNIVTIWFSHSSPKYILKMVENMFSHKTVYIDVYTLLIIAMVWTSHPLKVHVLKACFPAHSAIGRWWNHSEVVSRDREHALKGDSATLVPSFLPLSLPRHKVSFVLPLTSTIMYHYRPKAMAPLIMHWHLQNC